MMCKTHQMPEERRILKKSFYLNMLRWLCTMGASYKTIAPEIANMQCILGTHNVLKKYLLEDMHVLKYFFTTSPINQFVLCQSLGVPSQNLIFLITTYPCNAPIHDSFSCYRSHVPSWKTSRDLGWRTGVRIFEKDRFLTTHSEEAEFEEKPRRLLEEKKEILFFRIQFVQKQ